MSGLVILNIKPVSSVLQGENVAVYNDPNFWMNMFFNYTGAFDVVQRHLDGQAENVANKQHSTSAFSALA